MSLLAMSLARTQHVGDALAKFLLIMLADRHNADTGDCHPSVSLLAHECEITTTTVHRKLDLLESDGFIRRTERTRQDGGRDTTQYDLLFVPSPAAPNAKPHKRRGVPHADWQPQPETVEALRRRYPHHEIHIESLVREFVNWARSADRAFSETDRAFTNSAERHLKRQSPSPSRFGAGAAGQRRYAGGVSGNIRDLLSGEGG